MKSVAIFENPKGDLFSVVLHDDCEVNKGGLWCEVYPQKEDGCYSDERCADFCIHPNECDCGNYDDVLDFIQDCFYDPEWFCENIDSTYVVEDDFSENPSAGIRYFEDRGKKLLKSYNKWLEDKSSFNCGKSLLEDMADFITDFVYSE